LPQFGHNFFWDFFTFWPFFRVSARHSMRRNGIAIDPVVPLHPEDGVSCRTLGNTILRDRTRARIPALLHGCSIDQQLRRGRLFANSNLLHIQDQERGALPCGGIS
jgi:hypothetical protein